ncbi:MAG TPA: hypothetical protein VIN61_05180 [Gammaproteobacteria bacterium]
MRRWILLLSLLGLVLSGFEGVAEELDSDACDSGPGFELHHDHSLPDGGSGDGPGGDSTAAHFCHCAAHGVPLASWWSVPVSEEHARRWVGPQASFSSFAIPPPVKPPIA